MDKTGQDTDGFRGGIFSSQGMDSGKDAVYRDAAGMEGMGSVQGQREFYGQCLPGCGGQLDGSYSPAGSAGRMHGDCRGQAAGITGMPLILDCGDGYYDNAGKGRPGDGNGCRGDDCVDNRYRYAGCNGSSYSNSIYYADCDYYSDYHDMNYNGNGYNREPYNDNRCHSSRDGYGSGDNGSGFCGNVREGREGHGLYGCRFCQGNLRPEEKSHWYSDRLLLCVVAVVGMGMLFLSFLAVLFFLICVVVSGKPSSNGSGGEVLPYEEADASLLPSQEGVRDAAPGQEWGDAVPGEKAEGEYYGEVKDAVRTDLSYSVEWGYYEYDGNSDTVMIAVDYPVIVGDVPNIDLLNEVIAGEIDYFQEYYDEYSKYMLEDEVFGVYSEGYVTYMDEEVMSVVFAENIYTDYWVDSGLYCVNIDIENGVILDNSGILDVDDEFAIDFRTRSREQNGDVGALEYLTDQEVAYYLTSGSTGIIFFTPLGMEIGLNYGEGYVTVTYKDYREFLMKY